MVKTTRKISDPDPEPENSIEGLVIKLFLYENIRSHNLYLSIGGGDTTPNGNVNHNGCFPKNLVSSSEPGALVLFARANSVSRGSPLPQPPPPPNLALKMVANSAAAKASTSPRPITMSFRSRKSLLRLPSSTSSSSELILDAIVWRVKCLETRC